MPLAFDLGPTPSEARQAVSRGDQVVVRATLLHDVSWGATGAMVPARVVKADADTITVDIEATLFDEATWRSPTDGHGEFYKGLTGMPPFEICVKDRQRLPRDSSVWEPPRRRTRRF